VRVGEISGDEYKIGTDLRQQPLDDRNIGRADGVLPHFAGLVKRQVQESSSPILQSQGPNPGDRLRFADDSLGILHFLGVHFPCPLG
jgi:hypothetical protein